MTDIEALIARLENATEGSRELDETIAHLVDTYRAPDRGDPYGTWPHYTESLDAALTLLPAGAEYQITTIYGIAHVELPLNGCDDDLPRHGERADGNVAMAFCIAALKARSEIPRGTGDSK